MKKLLSLILALAIFPVTVLAAPMGMVDRVYSGDYPDFNVDTPEDYVFSIEGNDKQFILLDDTDGFFIMAKDAYGKRAFDPDNTQKFDIEDENNIAYWLNNEFLEQGNGSSELKLPDEIIEYADADHVWETEAGVAAGNCPQGFSTKAAFALLSQTEWRQYYKRFGVQDDMDISGWWLRTPRGINGDVSIVLATFTDQQRLGETMGISSNDSSGYYVRPVFYLKSDFFKNVRIDLDAAGETVISSIKDNFTADDLRGVYSDKEIRDIGIEIPFELDIDGVPVSADITHEQYASDSEDGGGAIEQGAEDRYILGAFAYNKRHNYEMSVNFSTENTPEGSVVLEQIAVDGKSGELAKKQILVSGGTKSKRDYAFNVVDVPEGAEFIVYRLRIGQGSGTVRFNGWRVKRIISNVSIVHDWAPMYVFDENAGFKVQIETNLSAPKTYNVEYSFAYRDRDYTSEGSVPLHMTEEKQTFEVHFSDIKRGSAIMTIRVLLGDNVVEEFEHQVCVMDDFDWSKYDGLPTQSINPAPGAIENTNGVILDKIKRAGFNSVRGGYTWTRLETETKGNYDYALPDQIMGAVAERGMDSIFLLCYSSPLYTEEHNDKIGPATPEHLEAFLEYVRQSLTRYPEITKIEIWNEPNNVGFWAPDGNVYAYANLVKAVSNLARQINPEIKIFAGAIDVSKNGVEWTRTLFDQGIYPYIDGFSTHPYYHRALNDESYLPRVESYTDIIEDYGGWKDVRLTEAGWTTYGDYDLETTLASEEVKILSHNDYLDLTCDIFNFMDSTEDFGMLDTDYTSKPSYGSVTNFNIQTNGATPLTKLLLNDECHTFLYKKDNEPMIISWCNTGGETTLELPGDNIRVYDMYGNLVSEGNIVPQNEEPYYIYGVDESIFKTGMSDRIVNDYNSFTERYADSLSDSAKEKIAAMRDRAANIGSLDAAGVEALISDHYAEGIELMKECGNAMFEAENTNMYYIYHKIGLEIADYLMTIPNTQSADSIERVERLNSAYFEDKGNIADEKTLTRDLLIHAKKYVGFIETALGNQNVDRKNIAAWNIIANKLCDWIEYAQDVEPVKNLGVYFNIVPSVIDIYEGEDAQVAVTAYNKTGVDRYGKLEIYSSGGELLETIEDVSIPAGGKTSIDITYGAKSDKEFGEEDWNILKFVDGENEYTLDMALNMKDKISLSLDHAEVPVNQLTEVSVAVTNESTSLLSGTLKVTPPEGWTLDSTQKSYTLNASETEHITFSVVSRRQTAFNFYNFAFEASDEEGRVLQRLERPLDFAVVVKEDRPIDTSEFTGDISDWSNAYPTYLNPPEDPDSMEAWRTIDVAARIFTKWDEDNFYILADVYDLYHNQENPGERIYMGDSIQFAIDADHTKSTAYDGGDYEYGAALDNFGTILFNAWQAPAGQTTGEKSAEWASILRNETNKNTRYYIKIPKENVDPMQLEEGNVIGFNLLLNDANLLGNRDHTFEITDGINTRKYPAAYRDWLFVGTEARTDNGWDSVAQIFTPTFEATEIGGFADISGHWAEQSIKDAYNKGLVSGMSKTSYAPDESLSVAQALQLIKNVYELPDAEYGGEFSDVGAEDWYAGAVASVAAAGMLPDELAPGGTLSPNREITREEFAMVIAAADKEYQSAGLTFADAAEVSENAKDAVGYVFEKGYMIGNDRNRFEPKKPLTRAEAAVVMLKIAQ